MEDDRLIFKEDLYYLIERLHHIERFIQEMKEEILEWVPRTEGEPLKDLADFHGDIVWRHKDLYDGKTQDRLW